MDENAVLSGTQNSQQAPQSGGNPPVGAVPVQNVPIPPAAPVQPVTQQPQVQQDASSGPRLTIADLYGPSSPQDLQPVAPVSSGVAMPQPEVPSQPVTLVATPVEISAAPSIEQPPVFTPQQEPVAMRPLQSQPVHAQETIMPKETLENRSSSGGGFYFSTVLRFLVGGVIVVIVLLIIWGLGSLLFSKPSGTGKVTLNYWGLWEDTNVMQPILADFQKQYPNITIVYTKQDPKDYTKRLLTRAQDGSGPDIFRLHNTWVYPLQALLLPLPTQVIDKKQLDTNYPPVVVHDFVQNGAIYGLPLAMDTLSLFVNKDIFTHAGAAVPTTWDNFITVAKALTVKDPNGKIKTAGAAIGTYENIAHAPDIISLLLLQNGASLNKLSPSQNTNDALTFYSSFAKADGSVWDSTLDNSLQAFARGKMAMYFGYSYDIFTIETIAPSLNFVTYPVPHLPNRDMTIASYWAEGVSNRSKHQKEALQLMQYLAQKDVQTKLYTEEAKTRNFGELYARTDLAEGLKANPLLAPFISQYKTAQSSFFSGETSYDEYNGALNRYLGNAINSMVQDTSVDSATATLAQGVSQVMSTYAPKTP